MVEINIYFNKIPLDCTKNICHALVTTHNEKQNQCVGYQCERLWEGHESSTRSLSALCWHS